MLTICQCRTADCHANNGGAAVFRYRLQHVFKHLLNRSFMLPITESIMRLLAAVIIGFIIGFTRRHKPAGLRTFALICLGSAIFTIISIDDLGGDKTRIIGQIVSGIGFLGLGVIWKQGFKLSGLTTAAAIWVTASIGVLLGLALWAEAATATILTILVLFSRKPLERTGLEGE